MKSREVKRKKYRVIDLEDFDPREEIIKSQCKYIEHLNKEIKRLKKIIDKLLVED